MKTLNEYIKESLLDDEEDLAMDDTILIKQFLKDNYRIMDEDVYIDNNENIPVVKFKSDVNSRVYFDGDSDTLTDGLFKWGDMKNTMFMIRGNKLKTLEGAPNICKKFIIYKCQVKSLEHSPKICEWYKIYNLDIIDLTGISQIGLDLTIENCDKLRSFNGLTILGKNITCNECNNLGSLKGLPRSMSGMIDIENCNKIKNLIGVPEKCDGLCIQHCAGLKTLEGCPKFIGNYGFFCYDCKNLTSLKGVPSEISGGFCCTGCAELKSLKDGPKHVEGNFDCSNCDGLIDLVGAPKMVDGHFVCSDCSNLESLEGGPSIVNAGFNCKKCPKLNVTKEDVKKLGNIKGRIYV